MKTVLTFPNSSHGGLGCKQAAGHQTTLTLGMGFGAEAEMAQILVDLSDLAGTVAQLSEDTEQESTSRINGDNALDTRINNQNTYINGVVTTLNASIAALSNQLAIYYAIYPKLVMAGVVEMVTGAATISRPTGSTIDFTDSRYAISLTPEGPHEAWTITRNESSFDISVFNRSGTNRIGYSGKVSYAIFQTTAIGA